MVVLCSLVSLRVFRCLPHSRLICFSFADAFFPHLRPSRLRTANAGVCVCVVLSFSCRYFIYCVFFSCAETPRQPGRVCVVAAAQLPARTRTITKGRPLSLLFCSARLFFFLLICLLLCNLVTCRCDDVVVLCVNLSSCGRHRAFFASFLR